MAIKISAIICTRNRAVFLEKCLKGLLHQTLAKDYYEIIVVDNGSTDNTQEVLAKYFDNPLLRVIYEPIAGLSRARNRGWQESQAPYIGYIDDDAVPCERWLEDALWSFKNIFPEPDWVGGPVTLEWEGTKPKWITEELSVPLGWVNWGNTPRPLKKAEWLIGANSCFSRTCLEKHGGFDERLGRQGACLLSGEETQLKKRIESSGGTLYYHPGVTVRHFVPKSRAVTSWFYRRYFWGGVTDVYMEKTLRRKYLSEDVIQSPKDFGQSRMTRLLTNILFATGLSLSVTKTVHARIYVSYVFGWMFGIARWRKDPLLDESRGLSADRS